MDTLFQNLPDREIAPVLIVMTVMATGLAIVATTVISFHWRKVRDRQISAGMVKDMLDRGMTSDEICDVMVSAGARPRDFARRAQRAPQQYAQHAGYQAAAMN